MYCCKSVNDGSPVTMYISFKVYGGKTKFLERDNFICTTPLDSFFNNTPITECVFNWVL